MSTNNYAEDLFEAISTIVEKRVSNLEFDKTIICTVVDTSKATAQNLYTVTDGSVRFEAQGNGGIYAVNDQVRVSIVNGDFSKDKFIQGKYNPDDTTKPITYVSPLNSVIKITDNLFIPENAPETWGIVANGSIQEVQIGTITFTEDVQNKNLFDTLYLSAEFQTNFDQYTLQSGDYGLHVIIGLRTSDKNIDRLDVYLDATTDMFGNPYAFKIFTQQEIKYNFSQWIEGVEEAWIYLYQKDNFTYYDDDGTLKKYEPTEIGGTEISDIKVKNVVFGFGAEVSNLPKGGVKVYTNDSTNFRSDDNEDDNRILRLQWYNSSDNNEYIGFSDGVYDPDYDEKNYLSAAAANTRLLARRSEIYPDDELSLSLLADGYDIYNAANSAKQLIDKNLPELLRGFRSYLSGIVWSSGDPFATLLGADTGSLGDIARAIGDNASKVNNQYKEVFKWVKSTKQDLDKKPKGINNDDVETDFTTPIVSSIESVITATDAIYNTVLTTVNTTYSSYENIYTSYKNRWDALKEKINKLKTDINKWHSNSDGETNTIKLGKIWDKVEGFDLTAESIVPYTDKTTTETFKNTYDNKYCIYWYRYDNEYTGKDSFMEAGWEKLENSMNVGLPGAQTEAAADGKTYFKVKPDLNETGSTINITLREKQEEKFAVVIFANHKKYVSDPLVFTNLYKIPDSTAIDVLGALSLEHKNAASQDTYQLYSSSGHLINASDVQTKRLLKATFKGASGGDEQLIGGTVYWYIPQTATLLDVFPAELSTYSTDKIVIYPDENAFNIDYERGRLFEKAINVIGPDDNKYKQYTTTISSDYSGAEKRTGTKAEFENDYSDLDTNKAYVIKDTDGKYYKYQNSEGTWTSTEIIKFVCGAPLSLEEIKANSLISKSGYTCYYRTITEANLESALQFPYHIKSYYQPTDTQNTILCEIKKGTLTYQVAKSFTFASFGTSGTDYTLALIPDPIQPVVIPDDEKPLTVSISLRDYNNKTIGLKNNNLSFGWIGPSGCEVMSPLILDMNENVTNCKIKHKNTSSFYGGILQCSTQQEIAALNNKKINLSTQISIPYAPNNELYLEGPSIITYDSNGGNPQYYRKPYKLYNKSTGEPQTDVTWSIEYYEGDNSNYNKLDQYLKDDNGTITDTPNPKLQYSPHLIENDTLVPSIMYVTPTSNASHIYPVVFAKDKDNVILWAQPIIITQNTYSSSLLNEWDGSLSIDEENGTILSTMVGAGRKDEDNCFEGVLMGDVATTSNDQAIITTGLYGFHKGAQSFGFKVDGTAFLGKSGHGRIEFNGNTGVIYSSNWLLGTTPDANNKYTPFDTNGNLKISTQGMAIDLTNGYIDAYNFKLTSRNILMQSGNDVDTYFKITDDSSKILVYMGPMEYYMQSSNYSSSNKTGVNINLSNGVISGYDFTLRGEQGSGAKTGSFFNLSSNENNFFEIHYKDTDKDPDVDVSVIKIDTNDYYLHSFDWLSGAQGTEIDLENGRWLSYCNTGTYDGKGILINAADASYPLVIGGSGAYDKMYDNATFKVAWDGSLSIADTAFKVTSEGNLSLGNGSFKVDKNGNLSMGNNEDFVITQNGALSIGPKNNRAFEVSSIGIMTATGATLTDLTVANDATFKGNIYSTGNVIFDGRLWLTTTGKEEASIYIGKDNDNKPQYKTYVDDVQEYELMQGWFKKKVKLRFYNGILIDKIEATSADTDGNWTTAAIKEALEAAVNTDSSVGILNTKVDSNSNAIKALQETASNHITKDASNLTHYFTKADTLKLYSTANLTELPSNHYTIAGNNQLIQINIGNISSNTTRITNLETAVQTINSSILSNDQSIANNVSLIKRIYGDENDIIPEKNADDLITITKNAAAISTLSSAFDSYYDKSEVDSIINDIYSKSEGDEETGILMDKIQALQDQIDALKDRIEKL